MAEAIGGIDKLTSEGFQETFLSAYAEVVSSAATDTSSAPGRVSPFLVGILSILVLLVNR